MPVLAALFLGLGLLAADEPRYGTAGIAGVFLDPELGEISGLASSRRTPGRYWAHNDGDDGPALYAVGADGQLQGRIELEGVRNIDWEDLASFELDGRPLLAVGDIGDNGGVRKTLSIHVIEEPAAASGQRLAPLWSVEFRPEDEPHDFESLAVDEEAGEFLLISKRTVPARLYRLPLRPEAGSPAVARPVADLAGIRQPNAEERKHRTPLGRYRAQPTAMDLDRAGREMLVLCYGGLYRYRRELGERWEDAVAREPLSLPLPALPQAEAMAVSSDGRILVTTENWPAPILVFHPEP